MSHPEIATLSGHLGNFRFLTPDYEEKKLKKRLSIFIIGCMSHPEKATSTGYLGNCRFLRLNYEDKSCLESKTAEKIFCFIGCMSHPKKLHQHTISEVIDF